jgi:hypothetical protein
MGVPSLALLTTLAVSLAWRRWVDPGPTWWQWVVLVVVGLVAARIGWRWLGLPFLLSIAFALVVVLSGSSLPLDRTPAQWVLVVVCAALVLKRRDGRVSRSEVERMGSVPGSWSVRGVGGLAIRFVAVVVFAGAIVVYFFLGLMVTMMGPEWAERSPDLTSGTLFRRIAVRAAWTVAGTGIMGTFLLLAAVLTGCYFLDRFGRRVGIRSLREAQQRDHGRGHYLWLRSFDEDKARLPARLRGGGLLGLLMPVRFVGFEELMATNLARVAPVYAVSEPGSGLPPVGAARVTLNSAGDADSDEHWKTEVEDLATTARAVVLSTTPKNVRPGFQWELQMVAGLSRRRIMVVRGPHTDSEERWRGFCEALRIMSASHDLTVFDPIIHGGIPSGVQVLAHKPGAGWRGFGAEANTDWSYSLSFQRALRYLEDDPTEVDGGFGPLMPELGRSLPSDEDA